MNAGADLLRKRMHAALAADNVREYLRLRRAWMRAVGNPHLAPKELQLEFLP